MQNGKLDLLQAEGLNDLINSESEMQHKLSIAQLQGKNSAVYTRLRTQVIKMLAHVEAYIDFEADETNDDFKSNHLSGVRAECN